ncbi:MAG: signal recognition particle-docking protein FtsY, partial [Candidatus Kariarchaeaceae archaeon]
ELDPLVVELQNLLMENEVAVKTADAIGSALKSALLSMEHGRFKSAKPMVEEALRTAVRTILEPADMEDINLFNMIDEAKEEQRAFVICIMGINGTGKTTTIAKLTHILVKKGYTVVLAASDTFRAGSIQQLGKHAENLGVRMVAQEYGSDPTSIAIDAIDHAEANGKDVVIIDTAGRMQNNVNLVRELEKIVKNTQPDLKIFVGDSLAGNDVIRQVEQFQQSIGIDGIIMTKLDSDVKGGAVISVAHTVGKPILFVGIGQSYDDLVPFDPEMIIKEVLP